LEKEHRILEHIRLNPFITQQELADKLGLSRSAIAGYISALTRNGEIKGRAYILREEASIVCIGTTNFDRKARSVGKLIAGTSNPVQYKESCGGVARNIAENLARLGLNSVLLSCVGNDKEGMAVLEETRMAKVDVSLVTVLPDNRTGSYTAILDIDGEMYMSLNDLSICNQITPKMIADRWSHIAAAGHVFIDANLTAETLAYVIARCKEENLSLYIDPVSVPDAAKLPESLHGIDTIFPNRVEASLLADNMKVSSLDEYRKAARRLQEKGVRNVVITLSEEGIYYLGEDGTEFLLPSMVNQVVDVTGAGDAFASGYMFGIVKGEEPLNAAKLGMAASRLTMETDQSVSSLIQAESLYELIEDKPKGVN